MASFHLMHFVPSPRVHGLNGYKEIIDTFAWGLEQLGHSVQYGLNHFADPSAGPAINIIFGCQMLPVEVLVNLPKETIVYNLEQLRGIAPGNLKPGLQFAARHFQVWDYSHENLPVWHQAGCANPVHLPIGFAPVLSRITPSPVQDIDVLIYGLPGPKRTEVFQQLCNLGVVCMFVCGLYGQARDDLIARSKLILNINLWDFGKIFEAARVSYLLANRKAVVCLDEPGLSAQAHWREALPFVPMEQMVSTCVELLENDAKRYELEQRGYEMFSQIPFLPPLALALEASTLVG